MFLARASVKSERTADSLTEFMNEIRGIVGERPITEVEFGNTRSRSIGSYPSGFEGLGGVVGRFAWADAYGMPEGWMAGHRQRVEGASLEEAQSELVGILDPDNLAIVIVGDRNGEIATGGTRDGRDRDGIVTVGDLVEGLELAPIVMLDDKGDPVPSPEASER
jgi:predicted Zn-dependent peptidase